MGLRSSGYLHSEDKAWSVWKIKIAMEGPRALPRWCSKLSGRLDLSLSAVHKKVYVCVFMRTGVPDLPVYGSARRLPDAGSSRGYPSETTNRVSTYLQRPLMMLVRLSLYQVAFSGFCFPVNFARSHIKTLFLWTSGNLSPCLSSLWVYHSLDVIHCRRLDSSVNGQPCSGAVDPLRFQNINQS